MQIASIKTLASSVKKVLGDLKYLVNGSLYTQQGTIIQFE
jgi:hypothetical protein